jgi:precorrin-2 dehydrogenase/sirohydrochlorin ferrochelatase
MEAFPAFFPLSGRRVVVAGEGDLAEAKARLLEGSPATIERVTGEAALARETYEGAALAFISSPDSGFCERAAMAAKSAHAPVNVTDHPELSDFHTPAIIDRGQVVAAIATAGAAPIVSALLRAELEAKIPAGLGRLAAMFGRLREETRRAFPDLAMRRAFLRAALAGEIAEAADAGDMSEAERRYRAALESGAAAVGQVWLIATPSSRDHLSLKAARMLAEADLLVLEDGVSADIAVLARRDAPRRSLTETAAAALLQEAAAGRQAVVVAGSAALDELAQRLAALSAPYRRLDPAPSA